MTVERYERLALRLFYNHVASANVNSRIALGYVLIIIKCLLSAEALSNNLLPCKNLPDLIKQNNLDEELSYCIMELNNHYTDETDLKTIRDKGAFRIVDLWMGDRLYRIEHKEED